MSLDPVTLAIISTGLSVAGTAAGFETQRKQANHQADAIERADELAQMDEQRQANQQYEADASTMNEHARRAREESALFEVITGEYGGGSTADRTAAIGNLQAGESAATIASNSQKGLNEGAFKAVAARNRTAGQLSTIARPSALGAALSIAAAGVGGYKAYKKGN